jgi:hypothetical protein
MVETQNEQLTTVVKMLEQMQQALKRIEARLETRESGASEPLKKSHEHSK